MRHIQLEDQLRIRFPARGAEFDEGFEVGVMAALMAGGQPTITRFIGPDSLDQLRALAERLNYRLVAGEQEGDFVEVTLQSVSIRPKLRLVTNS